MSTHGLIRFKEQYHERIWGGRRLQELYGKDLPPDKPIGEAWLVSDHPGQESVVANGEHAGRTLHELVERDARALLGSLAGLTVHGRFPLLLKLLDANDVLSVQVHPDDETAKRLGEADVGKTEMWHVLERCPHSELICGLHPSVTRESFLGVTDHDAIRDLMVEFEVEPGMSVFVPAGTVHAIGAGIVLAEIQQNSDITYRLYDWGRVGSDGKPRELHVEKALESIRFGSAHGGPSRPLGYKVDGAVRHVLAACRYFAAECVELKGAHRRDTGGRSFHILLGTSGELGVKAAGGEETLRPGEALVVPGEAEGFEATGEGAFLDYYVPDLRRDIVEPLQGMGCSKEEILRLGGDPLTGDLREAF